MPTIDEFPTLTERSSTPQNVPHQRGAWSSDARGINSETDFPALTNAANYASNTNAGQLRGTWREQQPVTATAPAPSSQSTTPKKAASTNASEDFPALRAASNAKIPPPVSMFSAWSTVKKTAKSASG